MKPCASSSSLQAPSSPSSMCLPLSPRLHHPIAAIPSEQKVAQILYFTSAQTHCSPLCWMAWVELALAGVGDPHGASAPFQGCNSLSMAVHPAAPGWPGSRLLPSAQRQRQQQPLLLHTSVFLALLCISVQELKLRSLAEALSVVTALRAVVRHSLAPSLLFSLFLFSPLSLQLGSTLSLWRHHAAGKTRDQRWEIGSKVWSEPLYSGALSTSSLYFSIPPCCCHQS